jgi:hypothetical protein
VAYDGNRAGRPASDSRAGIDDRDLLGSESARGIRAVRPICHARCRTNIEQSRVARSAIS